MTEQPLHTHWQKFLKDRDEASFSQIYKETASHLHAYGIGLGFPSETCMDAVQDIFYKLYFQKNELNHISNIHFYLFRSFKNRLLDIQKQQKITRPINADECGFLIEVSVSKRIEDEEERALLKQKVNSLLDMLTHRQREAVYLRYMQNLEYEEIAAVMHISAESARKMVYRALEIIRKKVSETGSLPFLVLLAQIL